MAACRGPRLRRIAFARFSMGQYAADFISAPMPGRAAAGLHDGFARGRHEMITYASTSQLLMRRASRPAFARTRGIYANRLRHFSLYIRARGDGSERRHASAVIRPPRLPICRRAVPSMA